MERIAFHYRIEEGQRAAYRTEHENVPTELESAYLDSAAGVEAYSVFEKDGHVFGYMEVEEPEVIRTIMTESNAQAEWDEVMASILLEESDPWMDEVYRMV
ncbi:L-rhamnose mutarotase [Halocatena pleomorpha]|uniref:L-rhamnose mutarotase n=1 Tax=Halocatena pleomorpha TaxID=1785090 RepID=A0A3P3RK76_9EURY|nr:L-rhamnose mutarotase [Halocatena pleomorpha]RRJ33822.1 L-rhamnose mutarotase [Halocatena pleomorpha]